MKKVGIVLKANAKAISGIILSPHPYLGKPEVRSKWF